MRYKVERLVEGVRVLMDRNIRSMGIKLSLDDVSLGGADVLTIDEAIEKHLVEGLEFVLRFCPVELIEDGVDFRRSSISWEGSGNVGSVELPTDYLRLVRFKMSDWVRGVSESVGMGGAGYSMCRSRYRGVSGCGERPRVAVGRVGDAVVLEFFGSRRGAVIEDARCVVYPRVEGGELAVPRGCRSALEYWVGSAVAGVLEEEELSRVLRRGYEERVKWWGIGD